ncbi:unnamed protein product [Dracunculus medinensis]|uniref:Mitochondrial nucleoid factor 1 n=1 Tax=Dracunculus medinensis TaxID=318479 RepID=A0A0N4UDZ0_DRAME|nr:unnamed protein product [Dracunculus medinensis]
MSNHLYRKFMELANRWPNEPLKKSNRNTVLFIRSEIEKYFRNEMNSNSNSVLCEKRLKSLEQLLSNVHLTNYPHSYRSGVFGLTIAQLQEVNSEEGRKAIGLVKRPSLFSKLKSFIFSTN